MTCVPEIRRILRLLAYFVSTQNFVLSINVFHIESFMIFAGKMPKFPKKRIADYYLKQSDVPAPSSRNVAMPEDEVVVVDLEPVPGPSKLTFVPYPEGSEDWAGFLRSREHKDRKHKAQCKYCFNVFDGRTPQLRAHKISCLNMPETVKRTCATVKLPAVLGSTEKVQSILNAFGGSSGVQEESDSLLALFLVTHDIPSR